LENQLRAIAIDTVEVEKTKAHYEPDGVRYEVEFKWGGAPRTALKEVQTVVNSFSSRFPEDVRNNIDVWTRGDNAGFIAISFYSDTRSLDELYSIIEPVLVPKISKVQDAIDPGIWNPSEKEIRIELSPEKMAAFQLMPKDVEAGVYAALGSH